MSWFQKLVFVECEEGIGSIGGRAEGATNKRDDLGGVLIHF